MPVAERRPLAFTWRFATIEAPAKVDKLLGACSAWRPDLLVFESADLADQFEIAGAVPTSAPGLS